MERDGKSVGGAWNYDDQNRAAFGRKGPPLIRREKSVSPNRLTRDGFELVEREFQKILAGSTSSTFRSRGIRHWRHCGISSSIGLKASAVITMQCK